MLGYDVVSDVGTCPLAEPCLCPLVGTWSKRYEGYDSICHETYDENAVPIDTWCECSPRDTDHSSDQYVFDNTNIAVTAGDRVVCDNFLRYFIIKLHVQQHIFHSVLCCV